MAVVLTVNAGSSSLRLDLVDPDPVDPDPAGPDPGDAGGRSGEDAGGGRVIATVHTERPPEPARSDQVIRDFLAGSPEPPAAAAHRLVHGGDAVRRPAVVDDAVLAAVRRVADLAPLHVPPTLALIESARRLLPDVPHVVCPDTGFHAGLPEHATTYPVPAEWRERYGLRRYGFHGISYAWAVRRAAALLGRPVEDLRLVLAHLGGGGSVCAVRGGRSVDTSMGFTPLEGVPMSKRSGSVDPGMLLWLLDGRLSRDEVEDGLERRSGLLGLSGGLSLDTRDLVKAERGGDRRAALALEVFCHRVAREIAAEATSLDRLDALVFTGEIGWDQPEVREAVTARLGLLGVAPARGANREDDGPVSEPGAAVPVLVVQAREELQLAREALAALR
ncbi:acetate/propionate family kinase [Bailinhaonella thermotolerans]|uniref:Acetate kinase n=1 Tax=Bailinhaonella thermotolerans TaxID=1070861 RepID=A0A3A4B675_9ACTN|nr:acetate/propionate family kinase [Bailinhaonella thermotolerans]RJL34067.1 acetate/propionate family kinase [Bailinhaonella thermotolerans]